MPGVALYIAIAAAACDDGGTGPGEPTRNATGRVFTIDGLRADSIADHGH